MQPHRVDDEFVFPNVSIISMILSSNLFLDGMAKLSLIFSFAWSINARASGIAGFSSPSTTLSTIRSGAEALRQSLILFQNSVERTMSCTSSPAFVFCQFISNPFFTHKKNLKGIFVLVQTL